MSALLQCNHFFVSKTCWWLTKLFWLHLYLHQTVIKYYKILVPKLC